VIELTIVRGKVKVCCKVMYIHLKGDHEYVWHVPRLLHVAVGTRENRTMVTVVSLMNAVRRDPVKRGDDATHQDCLNISVTSVRRLTDSAPTTRDI